MHDVMTYGRMEVQLHSFLTLELDGGDYSASCLGRFTSRKSTPSNHQIGVWVDPTASTNILQLKKSITPAFVFQPTTY